MLCTQPALSLRHHHVHHVHHHVPVGRVYPPGTAGGIMLIIIMFIMFIIIIFLLDVFIPPVQRVASCSALNLHELPLRLSPSSMPPLPSLPPQLNEVQTKMRMAAL